EEEFSVQSSKFKVGEEEEELLRLAGSLAVHSSHPISQAIAAKSSERMEIRSWKEIRGAGIEGEIEDGEIDETNQSAAVRLGSLAWLKSSGVDLGPEDAFTRQWTGEAATLVGLAADKDLLGLFAVRDALKPGAAEVVRAIQEQGLK